MRLATIVSAGEETLALVITDHVIPLTNINKHYHTRWNTCLYSLLSDQQLDQFKDWVSQQNHNTLTSLALKKTADITPLYRHPRKIWGIGLNYAEHAGDLEEKSPTTAPASFMKPDTTIIGPGDAIQIPKQSQRTTAEAELGVIIGKRCKNITPAAAPEYVAGFTNIIDMTAEDILRQNPRYLTRSKSFDTFFSFGPYLVTPDEVADVLLLEVATVINGSVHRKNYVNNMTFNPWELVAFHSQVMTLLPGDIISTGTPGAVVIADGDEVSCEITGFPTLQNSVMDLKTDRA
ncbi:fumarylacetoacetate hydrolase family protein [Metallumcola ferriviriculae]|uniref:Fumarylacetoacetate hydrolase family protein n=1 Tax=Metallumcola ferriviriculae TaxID=3039180 RepID=A0AAU0UST0_9FIRM|nr:fumarylacetoacetate hydrolase family protein [Desulfitibacteraceae bacterium MK1]